MDAIIKYSAFFLLYVFGSRVLFIPAGITMGIGKYVIFCLVFCLDMLQIPLYFYLYEKGTSRIRFLNFLYSRMPTKQKLESSRLMRFAESLGSFGVVLVAAMPAFGGGMWTSVLMAYLLGIERKRSILLLALGSFLGCVVVIYGFEGILHLFDLLKQQR